MITGTMVTQVVLAFVAGILIAVAAFPGPQLKRGRFFCLTVGLSLMVLLLLWR